eukprot:TRINITY_DN7584_c0_g1_i1.p1 TRINITY_DN7584_c0_g1~~TRINITY_DN7584_c0_g1_i1.p1  ORF type:complete len:492 (+),score=88.86 TRINITY_DN7584_c0_g1_i1:111-1586(+)
MSYDANYEQPMCVWVSSDGVISNEMLSALGVHDQPEQSGSRGRSQGRKSASFYKRSNSTGTTVSEDDSVGPVQSMRSKSMSSRAQSIAVALKQKMDELEAERLQREASNESKPAAVTAAVLAFMLAMLSGPLGPCIPQTHLHLSRLPISAGHSVVIDALKSEFPDRDFDVKLHVYQKTKHVSGVASATPGLTPDQIERLNDREHFLPLPGLGEKMVVEESMRDRQARALLQSKYLVMEGLGMETGRESQLKSVVPEEVTSPIVYLRVMADRSHGLLSTVSDLRDEGLLFLLSQYSASRTGRDDINSAADLVNIVAPDKSANRRHIHRSHFGRAYFLECIDVEGAKEVIALVKSSSNLILDGVNFSLHVETKKAHEDGNLLFKLDPVKRATVASRLAKSKLTADTALHKHCGCPLPEYHSMASHDFFNFKAPFKFKAVDPSPVYHCSVGSSSESLCESYDTISVEGTEFTDCSESYQPYTEGYGFPVVQHAW